MAPFNLDGFTLGEKHRAYNKLINEGYEPSDSAVDDDIQTLLKIDVACKKRDVNYILEVLKSEDQLHVSKAIKRSAWLITDPEYANIINPEHLYTQLHPQMTSKAFNKLILNIRLQLKDPKRVEEFYNYIKNQDPEFLNLESYKWLQHCSVPFVEVEVVKLNEYSDRIPKHRLVRLFEKSFSIYEKYVRARACLYIFNIMIGAEFLVKKYPEKFLDFLESLTNEVTFYFNEKSTKVLMEKCYQKVIDNFEFYSQHIHLTFVKYLKNKDIGVFLLQHVNNENLKWLFTYRIEPFINYMPKTLRFEFVKAAFIDKDIVKDQKYSGKLPEPYLRCAYKCAMSNSTTSTYELYKYAPFEIAFPEIKKLMRAESAPAVRNLMLQVLLSCAGRHKQNIHTVLQYYHDKHMNEPYKFKSQFVNYFISQVDAHYLDDNTWKILNQLFHSMEVYIASENNVQSCIRSIIVRNIIRNEEISDIIVAKFDFVALKNMQKKLKTEADKNAVFNFVFGKVAETFKTFDLSLKHEFHEAALLCETMLKIIRDWKKELLEYPDVLKHVQKLIDVNKVKDWGYDLSSLYTVNKRWKRAMFEESLVLCARESVCINALKHDPGLLTRHKNVVASICSNDTVSLRKLLCKIRLYWPNTLAEEWKRAYLERLEQPDGHKALIDGLCILLPPKELNALVKKYAPSEKKIAWDDTNQLALGLRKLIAKNIHKARPLASIEEILPYTKGDYLQFAVPSLTSILSQFSLEKIRKVLPMLLDAPVSLKKFGIRCAFDKLNIDELKPMLIDTWNSTKNSTIKTILFTQTYTMLCKEKDDTRAIQTWELLSMFIGKLTSNENKLIYLKLADVRKVPDCVKPQLFTESFLFLISLPPKCDCHNLSANMLYFSPEIMGSLEEDFVVNVLLKYLEIMTIETWCIKKRMFSSFILSSKDEETQIRRYQKTLEPVLKEILPMWETVSKNEYRFKNHVNNILSYLVNDMVQFTFENKMQIPVQTYGMIQLQLETALSYEKEYVILTTWKLVTIFIKLLSENSQVITNSRRKDDKFMTSDEKVEMYNEAHKLIAPPFAKLCEHHLKEDLKRFGPSIYYLFEKAYHKLFNEFLNRELSNAVHRLEYAKCLLRCSQEKEIWLMVSISLRYVLDDNRYDSSINHILGEIREMANLHPSVEVKIHFNELFSERVTPSVPGTSKAEHGCGF